MSRDDNLSNLSHHGIKNLRNFLQPKYGANIFPTPLQHVPTQTILGFDIDHFPTILKHNQWKPSHAKNIQKNIANKKPRTIKCRHCFLPPLGWRDLRSLSKSPYRLYGETILPTTWGEEKQIFLQLGRIFLQLGGIFLQLGGFIVFRYFFHFRRFIYFAPTRNLDCKNLLKLRKMYCKMISLMQRSQLLEWKTYNSVYP